MATKGGIWIGNPVTPVGYEEIQKDIVDVATTIAGVQASVLEFIANYTPASGGNTGGTTPTTPTTPAVNLPANILDLLARVLPDGGAAGQLPYRTAGGYAWGNPPAAGTGGNTGGNTGGGTTPTDPSTPTDSTDYSQSVTAMDSAGTDMSSQAASLD